MPPASDLTRLSRRCGALLGVLAFVVLTSCAGPDRAVDERVACSPVRGEMRSISVEPAWVAGEERVYEVTKTTDYGGGLVVSRPGGTIARLDVAESASGEFDMSWTAVPLPLSLALWQFEAPPVAPVAAGYEWGGETERPRLTNAFELGLWLGEAIDRTRWGLPSSAVASFDRNIAHLEAMTASEFDLVFLKPAELLHAFEGVRLDVDEKDIVWRTIATGLGDASTASTVEIADLIDANDCVAISMYRAFQSDGLVPRVSREEPTVPAPVSSVEQTLLAQYDVGTRRIASVTMTEVATSADLEVTETMRLVDLTP